ncbi:hypothetical protein [Anaeromyxobacter paludicola]|uniref:hypothetical protein n=1 Tax=Anaeromyxobacter paludicola TaxID=2918171 RepID=UPI0020BE173D|nr:hypothetical protein [Anaeromyxobacter paludicola]
MARGLAWAAYLGAVALFVLLQEVGLRLRRDEQRAWWAGTGRDVLNAAGFAALAGALRLYGFPWPAAVLAGGSLTLLLFGAYVFMATQTDSRRPRAWALAAGLCAALPVLCFPGALVAALGELVGALFAR